MDTSKTCPHCHVSKPLTPDNWQRHGRQKSGYSAWCRDCDRERDRTRYSNPYRHAYKQAETANRRGIGNITALDVMSKERDTCYWCNRPFESVGNRRKCLDHVIPLSRGGKNSRANIEYVCISCNRLKGSLTIRQWLNKLASMGYRHKLTPKMLPIQMRLPNG